MVVADADGRACERSERGGARPSIECPTPRLDRVLVDADGVVVPIRCGRNSCPVCRGRNVMVTAAMMGLNAVADPSPPRLAVLTTTREWVDDATLRDGWRQFARRVRRDVAPGARYAWFREWTTGSGRDGVRRTHYHSLWCDVQADDAPALAEVSRSVWARIAGAYSPEAHGAKRVYDAGGVARYVAGLAGHHLKSGQAPPPGWAGRRVGTSRGYYAIDARELRRRAELAVRDERLIRRLERELLEREFAALDYIPADLFEPYLTDAYERAIRRPPPRVVAV